MHDALHNLHAEITCLIYKLVKQFKKIKKESSHVLLWSENILEDV
jgi:hypothetical protein